MSSIESNPGICAMVGVGRRNAPEHHRAVVEQGFLLDVYRTERYTTPETLMAYIEGAVDAIRDHNNAGRLGHVLVTETLGTDVVSFVENTCLKEGIPFGVVPDAQLDLQAESALVIDFVPKGDRL